MDYSIKVMQIGLIIWEEKVDYCYPAPKLIPDGLAFCVKKKIIKEPEGTYKYIYNLEIRKPFLIITLRKKSGSKKLHSITYFLIL